MRLRPRFFFNIQDRRARIYVSKVFSTYRVTLTDLVDRVITSQTSRSSGIVGGRKKKRSPLAMEAIMRKIISVLKDHAVNRLEVIICFRRNRAVYYMFRELDLASVTVWCVMRRRKIAHNGVRLPKKRRK